MVAVMVVHVQNVVARSSAFEPSLECVCDREIVVVMTVDCCDARDAF